MPKGKKRKWAIAAGLTPQTSDGTPGKYSPKQFQCGPPAECKKKKLKSKKEKTKKMMKTSSTPSSSRSPSLSTKDRMVASDSERNPVKASGGNKKAQCDLCKLSYTTEKELMEHLVSLMHHTKMEDKEDYPLHICTMCGVTCASMAEYRQHISTDAHQNMLTGLRGSDQQKEKDQGKNKKKKHYQPHHPEFGSTDFYNQKHGFHNAGPFPGARMANPYNMYSRAVPGGPPFNKFVPFDDRAPYQTGFRHVRFGRENSDYHWRRDGQTSHQPWRQQRHRGGNDSEADDRDYKMQQEKRMPRSWGSGAHDFVDPGNAMSRHRDMGPYGFRGVPYNRITQYPQQKMDHPDSIDFTSDDHHADWDEHSLQQQEQFLASMEDTYPIRTSYVYRRSDPAAQSEDMHEIRNSRWDDPRPRERKRPRNEDDVQQSLAKSSRSSDLSSDDNIPVRDIPDKFTENMSSPSQHRNTFQKPSPRPVTKPSTPAPSSSIDEASNNILERAELLCKQLREKREASQAQRNVMLKKQEREFLNQKMSALLQQQRSYLKGHIKESEKSQKDENDDSGISPASTQQSRHNGPSPLSLSRRSSLGSNISTSKPKAKERTLDEIRKSIEKSVLDDKEKSESRPKSSVIARTKQRTLSGGDTGAARPGETMANITGRTATKPAPKPQLTKDSLKKMVNAPRSRDERLQMAKLLHSREEHKIVPSSAPRTNLQLEGIYDAAVASEEFNSDMSPNINAQTIKLEDLSDSVRQQILELIGADVASQQGSQSESETSRKIFSEQLAKARTPEAQRDVVIVLSDDDSSRIKSKNKKNNNQRSEQDSAKLRTGIGTEDVSKAKKKKKNQPGPASSKGPSKGKSTLDLDGNLRPTAPVQQSGKAKDVKTAADSYMDSDVEVVSCSSDMDSSKSKDTNQLHHRGSGQPMDSYRSSALYKPVSSLMSSSNEHETVSGNNTKTSLSSVSLNNQTQLNSVNVKEKFPTLMNFPKSAKTSLHSGDSIAVSSDSGYAMSSTAYSVSQLNSQTSIRSPVPLPEEVHRSSSPKAVPSSFSSQATQDYSSKEAAPKLTTSVTASRLSMSQPVSSSPILEATQRSSSPQLALRSASLVSAIGTATQRSPEASEQRPPLPQSSPRSLSPVLGRASSPQLLDTNPSTRLTLPPSTWLADRTSVPSGTENQSLPANDSLSHINTVPSQKEPKSGDIKGSFGFIMDDVKPCKPGSILVEDEPISVSSSTVNDETSSQAMSELLVLSEREEEVKQEMMSMELRLTRLHRLLEQAVVQINKCTERRNQLHEEEQDLSRRRLSLLRDAASSRQSRRSDASDLNISFSSDLYSQEHPQTSRTGQSKTRVETSTTATISSAKNVHSSATTTTTSTSSVTSQGHTSRTILDNEDDHPATSLSRADWLAKFSSYLPLDPATESNRLTMARSSSLTSSAASNLIQQKSVPSSSSMSSTLNLPVSMSVSQFVPERDTVSSKAVEDVEMRSQDSHENVFSTAALVHHQPPLAAPGGAQLNLKEGSTVSSDTTSSSVAVGAGNSLFKSPIMYVGSFSSKDTPVRLTSPVMMLNPTSVASILNQSMGGTHSYTTQVIEPTYRRSDSHNQHEPHFGRSDSLASADGDDGAYNSRFVDLMILPNPPRRQSHGGEDSDIGSVASSIASGSSLGEQITRYCRTTPGASLDSKDRFGAHELSVIMSDTSERRGFDSQVEEEDDDRKSSYVKKEDWHSVVRPCSVPLERLILHSKNDHGIYGGLDKEAVRSAEALHLMERNYEGSLCPSSVASDGGKKKKRKTRQERDTSGLTRRRRHWVLSSSSEDGESKQEGRREPDVDLGAIASRAGRNGILSSDDDDSSDSGHGGGKEGKRKEDNEGQPVEPKLEPPSPNKMISGSDVTIAECDSSTNFGIVDSESIAQRTNTLKEMRDSFLKNFGRLPRLPQSQDSVPDINSTTSDAVTAQEGNSKNRTDLSLASTTPTEHKSSGRTLEVNTSRLSSSSVGAAGLELADHGVSGVDRQPSGEQQSDLSKRDALPMQSTTTIPPISSPTYEIHSDTESNTELVFTSSQSRKDKQSTYSSITDALHLQKHSSPVAVISAVSNPPFEKKSATESITEPMLISSEYKKAKSSLQGTESQDLSKLPPLSLHALKNNPCELSKMTCKFVSDYGPVVDLHVMRGLLYVGYSNSGVHVYDLCGSSEDNLVSSHSFPYLQCLYLTELTGKVTMIVGNGGILVFRGSNESEESSFSVDATIKCLLMSNPLVYAGLDTGEICVFDTKKMKQKDRFICADHPIHCLAQAQEGAMKLLCVSVQDGNIIVVNAQQGLPIRILTGHTKTAFSIQVDGSYVYSGSGDRTVLIQNLHTAAVEHAYKDSKGLVKSVFYNRGYLFTGGIDRLVRCYDTKTHKLVQVYYGAERGVITKILVLDNKLITGNISGSVDVVDLYLGAENWCHKSGCELNFGCRSHLFWHLLEDHNISSSS